MPALQAHSTKVRKWLWVAVAVVLIAALATYFSYNPEDSPLFPKCIVYATTGLKCPGCGSQRAVHFITNGEIVKAFTMNPLMVLSIPYVLVISYFEYLGGKLKYPKARKFLMGKNACLLIFAIVVGYFIARNIWNF